MNTQNEATKTKTPAKLDDAAEQKEHVPAIEELDTELQDIFRTTAARYGITI